jgi:predicted RNase H-like HicB family nuclease
MVGMFPSVHALPIPSPGWEKARVRGIKMMRTFPLRVGPLGNRCYSPLWSTTALYINPHEDLRKGNQMKQSQQFLGIIEREGTGYVALCPTLDIASQGMTVEEARRNLIEAIELFFETADPSEVQNRLHHEVFVTHVEVGVG